MLGVSATSRGVLPPNESNGRSLIPSANTITYFICYPVSIKGEALNMVQVRRYLLGDEKAISKLHLKLNDFFEEDYVSPQFIYESAHRPDFIFNVAEHAGEVTGFCGALFYESVGRAQIGPIAVSNEYMRQGIGGKLLRKTLNDLKEAGVFRVIARVKEKNQDTLVFFEKQGFRREALLEKYTKKGENTVQLLTFI
ncbi:MAG: GNAT family N-acetyltransferase [Candidatus Altiarchaeales archaeon]|nr:GNAT family N-acetyltransferase [Candidatus Altiarchaeales archaeon]